MYTIIRNCYSLNTKEGPKTLYQKIVLNENEEEIKNDCLTYGKQWNI